MNARMEILCSFKICCVRIIIQNQLESEWSIFLFTRIKIFCSKPGIKTAANDSQPQILSVVSDDSKRQQQKTTQNSQLQAAQFS